MKFALCDDETLYLDQLFSCIKEYEALHLREKITISCFSHGEDLLDDIQKNGEYDVYFLDIIMPEINGISLAKQLRENGYDGAVIYLTSSPEYAIESYRVRAYDYLLKPMQKEAIYSTLDSLLPSLKGKREKFTIVKTKEYSVKLLLNQIMYARLSNRIIYYYLNNGNVIQSQYIRGSFTDAVPDLISDTDFRLCGISMAVNLYHITKMEDNTLYFSDKYSVAVGTKAFRSLKPEWVDYCINKEI